EEEGNPQCMNDILNGIELLALLVEDVKEAGASLRSGIKGSFRVFLYDKNPYVSVFRAWHNDGRADYLAVGLLFQHRRGYNTPQFIVRRSAAKQSILRAVSDHIAAFDATSLLKWEKNSNDIIFNYSYPKAGRYDVFLCHNHNDKKAVREVAMCLREYGIVPWLDDWVLNQGTWVDALEGALKEVGCVAVFAGPNGAGPWQELEIRLSLDLSAQQGLRVIPVVLKGVEGDPPWTTGFLRQFQRVDFRKQAPDPVLQLVEMIRGSAKERSAGRCPGFGNP
ncbi:MAG TPA: toll/interleukin-1 receptor domain-containing protein, partial [Thermoanaerobaculia bacterium]|nr:toll/interleukin-1 receptor domain-containing protein [Thermoanaerobaculia bacterium]